MTAPEFANLRSGLAGVGAEELGSVFAGGTCLPHYEFLRVTRDGGRRVGMYGPGWGAPLSWPWKRVVDAFERLAGE